MTTSIATKATSQVGNDSRPLVSVVLSFRNEEEVIPELIERLQRTFQSQPVRYELIFVNDASTDNSLQVLLERREGDPNIKILNMSRRWGVSECVLAGMERSSGNAVIMMDADLQDPPEVIPEMIAKWQEGADVVYTVRASRAGESAVKMALTRLAYKAIRCISEIELPEDAGDFKLLSQRAVDNLLKMSGEKDIYLRGLVTWIGFRQMPVVYHRQPRYKGQTHFPIFQSKNPLKTLISGLTAFSLFPLQLFLVVATLTSFIALLCVVILIVQMLLHIPVPVWWPMAVIFVALSALQFIGIGVLGLYLGRIYNQIKGRPNYIVDSQIGFENKSRSPDAD
jgi:dolichol-phosphate mannosyltransferase